MNGLYITGCGEMGRVVRDDNGRVVSDEMVPSFHRPTLRKAFGRDLTQPEMDLLWEMQERAFITDDEIPLYEKWREMREVTGIEGSVNFADPDDVIGFRLYLNDGKVRASWEPYAPEAATEFWAAIEGLATIAGADMEELPFAEATYRQMDLSFDLTDRTADEARTFLGAVARSLIGAHELLKDQS